MISTHGRRWLWFRVVMLAALLPVSCAHGPRPYDPPFNFYQAPDFEWRRAARLLVLPLTNETAHPDAAAEIQRSLTAELQQLGRLEIVPADTPAVARIAAEIRATGRFNEAQMVQLARCAGADAVLAGTVSHYSPYFRPRIGLTLHVVSPDLGRVVSSIDGLWDSNDPMIADRARGYYARCQSLTQTVCNHLTGAFDDAYAVDVVLQSPHLFQRFVCGEAARLLVNDPGLLAELYPPSKASCKTPRRLRRLNTCPPLDRAGSQPSADPTPPVQQPNPKPTP